MYPSLLHRVLQRDFSFSSIFLHYSGVWLELAALRGVCCIPSTSQAFMNMVLRECVLRLWKVELRGVGAFSVAYYLCSRTT